VLRSKGHFWPATRPASVGVWSQAGRTAHYSPAGRWWADVRRAEWPANLVERIGAKWERPHGDRRLNLADALRAANAS